MTFKNLLKEFKEQYKALTITFGEKLSLTCKVIEVHDDYIKVNQMVFNKMEKTYTPTPYNYFIPLEAVLFIEEPRS